MATYVSFFFCGVGVGFVCGYLFARLDYIYVRMREFHEGASQIPRATGFFAQRMESAATGKRTGQTQAHAVAEKIDIDTRTVVTEIDTKGIQKGSEVEMGKTTSQQDTINDSVSKLAQLKGK